MVTTIGNEDDLNLLLAHLIELDYDAIEAYEAAVERLDDLSYRQALESFCQDHVNHTRNLGEILRARGETPPDGPGAKHLLAKGKVVMANMAGDAAILRAMLSNEGDTNTAYERAVNNATATPQVREVLEKNYADERKHKQWLEKTIHTAKAA